jgi:hypothetical protein
MHSFTKIANLHRVFFKRAEEFSKEISRPPIGNTKGSDNRPPAPPRPIGLPKGSDERPGVPLERGLSKKGPEERPTESPRTPKMMQKKGPVEIPIDPRPQIPGLQKGNREDWDQWDRSSNPTAKSTSGREPTQVELRHIMPNSGYELDPKEPAWKSDAGKLPVQFGPDESKRTALNTAHTPEPYSPPPDDHMLAYQSNSEQKFKNHVFANPFGNPIEYSNRVFMNPALRPNGPGSNYLPPSEIKQKITLPTHLRLPPFDKKDPTYGLE